MRSITFEIPGSPKLRIHAREQGDGSILFDLLVPTNGVADLRGLFFNITDNTLLDHLSISGADVTAQGYGNIIDLKYGNNVHGGGRNPYDVGISFGTPGIGKDDISSTSFVLSSTNGSDLTLDLIAQMEFAARMNSVGEFGSNRNGAQKISFIAPAAPDAIDDLITADEDSAASHALPNSTLIANDTDQDGDLLTIVALNGDSNLVDNQFTLSTGGLVTVNSDGSFAFDPNGQYEDLALGETRPDTFSYRITDELFDPHNQGFDTAEVTIHVAGRNDRPTAENVAASLGEDDASVVGSFVGNDIDTTDLLNFRILGAPTDRFGHEHGEVISNGDGTFTFNTLDNFQFLNAGESRDVTFQYVAIDDSGAENDTSAPKTITVTVDGAYDAPVSLTNDLLFETQNQSMWASGPALVLEPNLPFLGLEWTRAQTTKTITIVESETFSGAALDALADAAGWVANAAQDAWDWLSGNDSEDITVPSSITTPEVSLSGWTSGKVGLQPYFSMTSGDVDSSLPVQIAFLVPHQAEQGQTITLQTGYTLDGGATYQTASPNASMGLDLIFQFDAGATANIGGDSYTIIDMPAINESFNLIDFSAEDIEYTLDFEGELSGADLGNYTVGVPVINTVGTPDPVGSNTTLTSSGEDSVMSLTLDLDGFLSEAVAMSTGVAFPLEKTFSESIEGFGIELVGVEAGFNILDIELTGDLKAVQNFSLNIADLPLAILLENGTLLSGYSAGDSIIFDVPDFDANTQGDADGWLDYDVTVDIQALFDNLTTLGFDLTLAMEALSASIGITSDLFDTPSVSFGPVWDKTFEIFSTDNFATLFDSDPAFALMGFNQETFSGQFDMA